MASEKSLKRSNHANFRFFGAAELALGGAKRQACAEKAPRLSTLEDPKLATVIY
jgi:hypothetical protein